MTDDGTTAPHPDQTGRIGRQERMAKDMQEWKERISFSLDQRQIFFLCFGGALSASLIFVLGVMLGKRLEARTHLTDGQALGQPAHLAAEGRAAFEHELGPATEPSGRTDKSVAKSSAPDTRPAQTSTPGSTAPAPPSVATPPSSPTATGSSAALAGASSPGPSKAQAGGDRAKAPGADERAEAAPAANAQPAGTAQNTTEKSGQAQARTGKARYTLQLSSFQDRAEAEAFVKKFEGTGQKLFIVAADIPGRGVWYRVRLGEFSNEDAASSAKTEFEKKHGVIAYVMRY